LLSSSTSSTSEIPTAYFTPPHTPKAFGFAPLLSLASALTTRRGPRSRTRVHQHYPPWLSVSWPQAYHDRARRGAAHARRTPHPQCRCRVQRRPRPAPA
ncbi:hypothetical protein B0H10DRAFT_1879979, partial [Mycena sp. CBHHK59/15]